MVQRHEKWSPLLSSVLLFLACTQPACTLYHAAVDGEYRYAIEPQKLPSGMISSFFSALGYTLPPQEVAPKFKFDSTSGINSIYLTTLVLRTLTDQDFDTDGNVIESRLLSDDLAQHCESSQIQVNFIDTLEIWLKRDQEEAPEIRVTHYERVDHNPRCHIYMTIDDDPETNVPYNIKKKFFPKYVVTIKGSGSVVPEGVRLGGYLAIHYDLPTIIIPGD